MKKSVISIIIISALLVIISGFVKGTTLLSDSSASNNNLQLAEEGQSGLVFIPSSHDFGNVNCENDFKTYGFELKNNGAFTESGTVNLYASHEFSCISGCTYNIPSGQSHYYVTIKYEPYRSGPAYGTMYAGSASASFEGNGVGECES